jgi:hypothetical protein
MHLYPVPRLLVVQAEARKELNKVLQLPDFKRGVTTKELKKYE